MKSTALFLSLVASASAFAPRPISVRIADTALDAKYVNDKAAKWAKAKRPRKSRQSDINRSPTVYDIHSYAKPPEYDILSDPAAPMAKPTVETGAPEIVISEIFHDGLEKRSEGDEFIEISNTGTSTGDISGYRINCDDRGQDFVFPEGTVLQAGSSFRVYTNRDDPSTGGFNFDSNVAIWNNKGDVGRIFDASGELVDDFGYGEAAEEE